jgi:predicted helicase
MTSNNSYLEKRTFDGFRKVIADEFSHIYIIDLGGSVKDNPKLSGTTHNVFGIQAGVAIAFMVKSDKAVKTPAQIYYIRRPEFELAKDKLEFLRNTKFSAIQFGHLHPDKKHNWLSITDNDWDTLLPVALKESKTSISVKEPKAIFKLFSLGVVTNRDEWVYDDDKNTLTQKVKYLIDTYNQEVEAFANKSKDNLAAEVNQSIKWTRAVKQDLVRGTRYTFDKKFIREGLYRPFIKRLLYFNSDLNEMQYRLPEVFVGDNLVICFTDAGSQKPFMTFASNQIPDLHLVGAGAGTQCLPFYRYTADGSRIENITDWALGQFQKYYKDKKITKEDIFHYVYAVLHHPVYRAKYEINLKREFPRIPFYENFHQWAEWGKKLMDLHLNYEIVESYPLERGEREGKAATGNSMKIQPICRLIAHKEQGIIEIDTQTTLRGVPAEAWEYRLGTYSALEWILERYKEKKPKDPTIAEKFNTYRFADYKEQVIDLLMRVTTVSVETMKIVKEMPEETSV